MFLKSLEIFGFKSFADRTRIEFADGVTALLGPNGCGKSNVVDAIKWVLGEQATKSLRAENMEDVIFNGTETRKALNVAEVSLSLANDTRILQLDFPEVVIKRRLYRSGESEYYINNNLVKLKELRELFFDTGIGKSAYSIMEQGKIDQVLSTKPEERRHLFEEAASITKYRARGVEAERKLDRTSENMRQIEGILGEVGRSYETLRKQADKTSRYRILRDEVFQAELALQLLRLREMLEDREKRQKNQESCLADRDAVKERIDKLNMQLESSMGEVNTMEGRMLETQKFLYGLELEKNNTENQIRLYTERVAEIRQKIAGEEARKLGMEQKLSSVLADNAERNKTLDLLATKVSELDAAILRQEEAAELARKKINEGELATTNCEKGIQKAELKLSEIEEALRELTDSIVRQLDLSLGDEGAQASERREAEALLTSEIAGMRVMIEGRARLIEDARALGADAGSRALSAAADALAYLQAALERLTKAYERYREASPSFFDEFLSPEGTLTKKRDLDAGALELRTEIAEHRRRIQEIREERELLSKKIVEHRDTLEEFRLSRVRFTAQSQALDEQRNRSEQEAKDLVEAIEASQTILTEDAGRITGLEERMHEFVAQKDKLHVQEEEAKTRFSELEKGIHNRNKGLLDKERELKEHMINLAACQDKLERAQVALAETQAEIRNIYSNFRDKHSRELQEYEAQMQGLLDNAREIREKLANFREELRVLGSVNLMALEEFAEVKERYDFLNGQLLDLRKAREDLVKVTGEIREESSQLFIQTYEEIRKNFHILFRKLFGGGRAELRLSEPDQVLESGIEIYAQPPGKKLENIALLSGGEKSLTAVALLFATYMVKPSPFCLLDEIDAALDESNVGRFVGMLLEFAHTSQFVVITHNKKTVTGAGTLLGVTMQESGVSKVVSMRLSDKEAPRGNN